jgi:hypothetical protein
LIHHTISVLNLLASLDHFPELPPAILFGTSP